MEKIDFNLNERCGIYLIWNKISNKQYVGSSKNLYDRIHNHVHLLKRNRHHNNHLQSSFNKYGMNSFEYKILEFCDEEIRFEIEQKWISELKPRYNKSENVIANFGQSPSIEARAKASETLKRKYKSGEIKGYKQEHLWVKTYLYDAINFELIKEFENCTYACMYINRTGRQYTEVKEIVIFNKYFISQTKIDDKIDLTNYIIEKSYKLIYNDFYLSIVINDERKYFRSETELAKFIGLNGDKYRYLRSKQMNMKNDSTININGHEIYYNKNFIKYNKIE